MRNHYALAFCPQPPKFRRAGDSTLSDKIEQVAHEIDAVEKGHPSALEKTRSLHARVNRVMEYSERLGNSGEILKAAAEVRRCIELESRLRGQLETGKPDLVIRLRQFDYPEDHP